MKRNPNTPQTGTRSSTNTPSGASDNIIELKTSRSGATPTGMHNHTTDSQAHVKSAKKMDKTGADENALSVSGTKQVRVRGKDKQVRKSRCDNNPNTMIPADDRGRIVQHNLELYRLGRLNNRNDAAEVRERTEAYFYICSKNGVMPTVAGFALALGIDRTTLWSWMNNKQGEIKNPEVIDILKGIYSMINTQYEELLTEGKMIPVGAFFLMQNNHGYKNQTDHVITAQQADEPSTDDIAARAGLLEDK